MKRGSLSFALTLLVFIGIPALATDEAEEVTRAFSSYRSAILAGNGAKAAELVSRETLAFYDETRRLALFGDAEALQEQSLVTQIQILTFRLRVPPEKLESLSAKELVAYAIDQGWIGKDSVLQLQPGTVHAEGDVALLKVVVDGKEVDIGFRLEREEGTWRLNLLPTLQLANTSFQMIAKQQGVSERDLLLVLMESVIGRKLGNEAWQPLKSQAPAKRE